MAIGPLMIDVAGLSLSDEDKTLLENPYIGGVIYFSRNYESPEQLIELSQSIRDIRPELLITVDQEGGRVQRFQEGLTRLPAMRSFGELYDQDQDQARQLTEICGWLMASEMLSLGVDFSFAPVLDLDKNISEIIGSRAFHSDPDIVIELAQLFMHGMFKAGMPATGKHFPGHGSVAPDSHLEIPYDDRSLSEIVAGDMQPFKVLAHHGLKAVMPAHIIYSQVDKLPACFSSFWLQKMLRDELAFDGAIFSDDLSMQGASIVGNYCERAEKALAAGCDMILICNHREAVLEVLDYLPSIVQSSHNPRLEAMRGVGKYDYQRLLENPNYQRAKGLLS